jgi:hypothetical protein
MTTVRVFRFVISERLSGSFSIPVGRTSLADAVKVMWDRPPRTLGTLARADFRRARGAAIEQFRADESAVAG